MSSITRLPGQRSASLRVSGPERAGVVKRDRSQGVAQPIDIELQSLDEARELCGQNDSNLLVLRQRFGVGIYSRQGFLRIDGDREASEEAAKTVRLMIQELRAGRPIDADRVQALIPRENRDRAEGRSPKERSGRLRSQSESPQDRNGVKARTKGQAAYVQRIETHDLTFCIGPAGTGKTFLAVAAAVRALKDGAVEKIVLCRPAVEAGEQLGFLPGDLQAKINPFLRPLYDALHAVLDFDTVKRYQEREVIEVAPLAYMRGRTLRRSFIILDEGQNTTRAQMKMFLTRMGEGSKIVVTGDISQIDLPRNTGSGLIHALRLLDKIEGIAMHQMSGADIVRHDLVRKIVEAYDAHGDKP
jgi:phosphate starvation-inducible PhoH-like protein